MKTRFFIIITSCFLVFNVVRAANPSNVLINEVAWMGTENSPNDEWIELYNNTEGPINLDGWQLVSQDGTPKISLSGTIPAKGFYLLERTDDNSLPGIAMDQKYTGALGNSGENLELYDNFGNLIDSVNCSSGWFAGDNSTKQTMERKNSLLTSDVNNWGPSSNPGGTPKAENSPPPSEEPPTQPESQPKLRPVTYPSGIVINELIPSPEEADETGEWIELKNINNEEVGLSKWKIQDTIGSVTTYTFPEGTKIGPMGFLVLSRPTTKIILNNSGDGLLLIQPDGNTLDTVTYEKAPRGQSYNRTESGWAWSTTLTPGSVNIVPSPTSEIKKPTPSEKSQETQKELAALSEQIPKSSKSLYIFLIAPGLAIFSGAIILSLKKKLKMG